MKFVSVPQTYLHNLVEKSQECHCWCDRPNPNGLPRYLLRNGPEAGLKEIIEYKKYELLSTQNKKCLLEYSCYQALHRQRDSDLKAQKSQNAYLRLAEYLFWDVSWIHQDLFNTAISRNNFDIAKFIWEFGAQINLNVGLYLVCDSDDLPESDALEMVQYLWFEGADIFYGRNNAVEVAARRSRENRQGRKYKKKTETSKIVDFFLSVGGQEYAKYLPKIYTDSVHE